MDAWTCGGGGESFGGRLVLLMGNGLGLSFGQKQCDFRHCTRQAQHPVSYIPMIIPNTIKNVLHFLHGYFAFLRPFWGGGKGVAVLSKITLSNIF